MGDGRSADTSDCPLLGGHMIESQAESTGPPAESGIRATLEQTLLPSSPGPHPCPGPQPGEKWEFVQLSCTSQIAVLHGECEFAHH